MTFLLGMLCIILFVATVSLAKALGDKDKALKQLQRDDTRLNQRLSQIDQFKKKVEQGLSAKIQQTDEYIKNELDKLEETKQRLDESLKQSQLNETQLNQRLSQIDQFKKKVEQGLSAKIQQTNEYIKNELDKLEETKQRLDESLKQSQLNETQLNQRLSQIDQFKKKVEQGLSAKIQQTDEYIKNELDKLEETKQRLDESFLSHKTLIEVMQAAAEAIGRIIDGYGDEYIIPHAKLVDELAENYSLEHAGSKLKESRTKMRKMIRGYQATTAQNGAHSKILLDFFTTKAEELVGKVKHENYGKLKQELADVYALCNYYAQQAAFLDRITEEYYQTTQDELKWASIVHTMRIAEREEQREIREQMREEERARKEYERAIKDAAKEEDMLQRAMEKARAAYDAASAEQKARYEEQLNDLEVKLKEAEEKNQRALSMAQQTRAGNVYLISNIGSFGDNMMKIGMTRRLEPMDRVRELGDASVPFQFDVHAIIYSDDAPKLEKELHRAFNDLRVNKVNYRKEFFRVSVEQVKAKLDELGIKANFTLAAEAAEYRETLRIEAMSKDEQDNLLDRLLVQEFSDDE